MAAAVTGRLDLSDPVRTALDEGRPVVALETSVLAHGLPPPRNLEALDRMSGAIEDRGAVPAWTWITDGAVRIGGDRAEIERVATEGRATKVARRDLPWAVAGGGTGATTVSATLWAADAAGIEVAATGGIGGVHHGGADVSADLLELARTPGMLVCAGPKSIVDPVATLERLDELGVGVVGYRCDRLPFFLVPDAGLPLEHRADTPAQVAAAARARAELGIASTLLVCVPIPESAALRDEEVEAAVAACLRRAAHDRIEGKLVTPFLLSCLAEETGGRSMEANLALLESNAAVAAEVAAALAT